MYTNYKSLKYFFTQKKTEYELKRWLELVKNYDCPK